jgi:hypothetical protein
MILFSIFLFIEAKMNFSAQWEVRKLRNLSKPGLSILKVLTFLSFWVGLGDELLG